MNDGAADRVVGIGPFRIGEWTVDPALDQIARGGEVVKLEPRKMLLLLALARKPGEVVTLDQLLEQVWPGLVVTQGSIYQSVAQLRKTLGDSRSTPEYIATVPRKGYRLIATVGAIEAAPHRATPKETSPASSGEVDRTQPPPPPPVPTGQPGSGTRRRWLIGGVAGVGATALGAGVWWWRPSGTTVDGVVRLAVMPFSDPSEGSIEQAAADGLADDVIHRFERSDTVLVLARNSTFTFRRMTDERANLTALRQQLAADYALLGELHRSRELVRVSVRLFAIPSGKLLWASVIARPAERLAELPNAIASGTLKALGLPDAAPTAMPTLDAYELYLLGLNAYQTQRTMEGLRKARDYFQHAIDTDPTYARAYAGAALTWIAQAIYGVGLEFREVGGRAQPLIDKALAIDPALLEGLLAQGKLYLFTHWADAARARSFLQRAVDLYPGSAEAQFGLGVSYAYDQQPREAIKRYATALSLDPLNYLIHSRWGQDATFIGDFEAARVHFARAATLLPKNPWRFLGPAQADYARGRIDDAVANYRLQLEQDPRRPDVWGELGWLLLDLGMPAQARFAFDKRTELNGHAWYAGIDQAWIALSEGKASDVPALLTLRGLDKALEGQAEIDRLVVRASAGQVPSAQALGTLTEAMRADTEPWVGSYWIFLGTLAWIDLAMLFDLAGSPTAAQPLLDDASAMLTRLTTRGNAFHTIPYLEARIAALRGQDDVAVTKLRAAVDAGWRRAWMVAVDPALRRVRSDVRVDSLLARVRTDMGQQRTHVG